MKTGAPKKVRFAERFNSVVTSERPLRQLMGNFSRVARSAIAEANSLSIERVPIFLKRLPKKLEGFRIVHLSDIHHSPFTKLDQITRLVRAANRIKPDLFLLTGDYVSHETEYIAPVADALGKLNSKYGTYACLGNHDHWTDADLVTHLLRGEGINVLINEGVRFTANDASFWLCGVDDHMVGKTDLRAALRGSFPDEMKILLAHNPVIFRRAARSHVDLTLSGHTHGGQVKLREKIQKQRLLPRRRLTAGLHEINDSQIYVTRGIGTVVLPVRFQCPPEITVIELFCETE